MTTSELECRNIAISMRKSMENLMISSQDAKAITFSDTVTKSNPIYDTRNVSRSPSPSLRVSDSPQENADNDKRGEPVHTPSSAPVGGEAGAPTAPHAKEKLTSNDKPSRDGTGTTRSKKKSWYNSLYPTYKSKSEDFKRLFKDLPDDERLIVDYSCALQRDILAHGRLYASQNHFCFYASIFGWETSLTLRWKDVTAITKEKTALVIPNAILVCTETERYFLASFSGRDKAYLMLFRIWQNALMDQPVSSQEIWQWVHTCYGAELGFDSDEEGHPRDALDDALPPYEPPEEHTEAPVDVGGGGAGDGKDEKTTSAALRGRDDTPPVLSNGVEEACEELATAADTLPTDMSDSSDSEPDKHNTVCEEKCESSHEGRLIMQQEFPYNIDQMFTMIFTNSKFNLELLAARGTSDYVQAPWQPQNGLKCRQVSYTLGLTSGPIGPKEVHVTETQVMNKCSKAGALYSIDATSENAGIPYADHFSVHVHYCLVRLGENVTRLELYSRVHYKKTMWPMIKAFLEKNALNGTEEFSRLLESRLRAAVRTPSAPPARVRRRRRELTACPAASPLGAAPVTAAPPDAHVPPLTPPPPAPVRPPTPHPWLLIGLALLLLLNAVLYWKLYHVDNKRTLHLEDIYARVSLLSQGPAVWSEMGGTDARRHHDQLQAWRDALHTTVTHLLQTERALSKLLESMKPLDKSGPEGRKEL